MKVSMSKDGKKLTVEFDLEEPKLSSSGKNYILATTGGNVDTGIKIGDKPLILGLNAYYTADPNKKE